MSGDTTITPGGVVSIAAGVIVNADISASAAIAGSKLQAASSSNTGTLSYEDSGTFVANFNQGAATGTNNVTVTYRRIGKQVFLELPQLSNITMNIGGASISTAASTIPAALIPQRNVETCIRARDNGNADAVGVYGTCDVQTGGVIEVIRSVAWLASTTNCGWTPFCITYSVA